VRCGAVREGTAVWCCGAVSGGGWFEGGGEAGEAGAAGGEGWRMGDGWCGLGRGRVGDGVQGGAGVRWLGGDDDCQTTVSVVLE